jgi:ABC-2 type transport system permease protein
LATSIEPRHLLVGKIIANILVGLTHVVTWIVLGVLAIAVFSGSARFLSYTNIVQVGLIAAFFLLGTVFIAGLNSTIASLVPKPQLASMLTGLVTLPTMIPFMATQAISDQPGSPLSVVLSMFPVTAVQAMPVRLLLGSPPWWEILISFLLLAVSVWGVLRLAGWAFQISIRNGGKNMIRLKPFWKKTTQRGSHAQ